MWVDIWITRKWFKLTEKCARDLAANKSAIDANREMTLREIERLKREYPE